MSSELTDRQVLAGLVTDLDMPKIMLKPYEQLIRVREDTSDGKQRVTLLFRRFKIQDRRDGIKFTGCGTVMRSWTRHHDEDGPSPWVEDEPVIVWDPTFEPVLVMTWMRDWRERRERELWEAYCHRPGNARHPMESFEVTAVRANEAPAAMRNHWKLDLYASSDTEDEN